MPTSTCPWSRDRPVAEDAGVRGNRDHRPITRADVMTVAEVAEVLGVSRRHVYNLEARGELHGARRLGKKLIVVRPVLEAWLRDG